MFSFTNPYHHGYKNMYKITYSGGATLGESELISLGLKFIDRFLESASVQTMLGKIDKDAIYKFNADANKRLRRDFRKQTKFLVRKFIVRTLSRIHYCKFSKKYYIFKTIYENFAQSSSSFVLQEIIETLINNQDIQSSDYEDYLQELQEDPTIPPLEFSFEIFQQQLKIIFLDPEIIAIVDDLIDKRGIEISKLYNENIASFLNTSSFTLQAVGYIFKQVKINISTSVTTFVMSQVEEYNQVILRAMRDLNYLDLIEVNPQLKFSLTLKGGNSYKLLMSNTVEWKDLSDLDWDTKIFVLKNGTWISYRTIFFDYFKIGTSILKDDDFFQQLNTPEYTALFEQYIRDRDTVTAFIRETLILKLRKRIQETLPWTKIDEALSKWFQHLTESANTVGVTVKQHKVHQSTSTIMAMTGIDAYKVQDAMTKLIRTEKAEFALTDDRLSVISLRILDRFANEENYSTTSVRCFDVSRALMLVQLKVNNKFKISGFVECLDISTPVNNDYRFVYALEHILSSSKKFTTIGLTFTVNDLLYFIMDQYIVLLELREKNKAKKRFDRILLVWRKLLKEDQNSILKMMKSISILASRRKGRITSNLESIYSTLLMVVAETNQISPEMIKELTELYSITTELLAIR
jgi:hypothetical protein